MKKYLFILIVAVAAFGFTGCSDSGDSSKADLKWSNASGGNVSDIKWMSDGKEDQSWDGTVADTAETSAKGITKLAGTGDCLDNGGAASTIVLDTTTTPAGVEQITSNSATIKENATADLVISAAKKK